MDPELQAFFKLISYSIGIVFTWLAILAIAAIKGDNAFIGDKVSMANVIFYIWAVASTIGMVFLLLKLWKEPVKDPF